MIRYVTAKARILRLDKAIQQAKKESQEQERELKLHPLPLLGVPQNHPANNHNIYTEGLVQSHAGFIFPLFFTVC